MTAIASAPLVRRGTLDGQSLEDQVVIVTGAGGGIGLEAARSLLQLGAKVVIAEVDGARCANVDTALTKDWGAARVMVCAADVSDVDQVHQLVEDVVARFGEVDAVVNNATFAPAGAAVAETPIEMWDRSYAVNLRAPALFARECLPGMVARGHGAFVCVSSTGGPFLAPYETLKAAQVALASSLDAELAGTGVTAFTIGPGLVPTETALAAIDRVAPRLGMSVSEFWRMNRGAVLSVEAAGAGFAAAVAMAARYAGQEISSTQALVDAGIAVPDAEPAQAAGVMDRVALERVRKTLEEQVAGWKQRSFFERQWMLRDFKQRVGLPVERCLEELARLEAGASARALLDRLAAFYAHMGELAAGYVKDPGQRAEQMATVGRWRAEVEELIAAFPMADVR